MKFILDLMMILFKNNSAMKKTIILFIVIIFNQMLAAQNKNVSFDQLSFSEPANWKAMDNGSYRTYSTANNSTNIYCVIAMYNSNVASGNPEQDFLGEWKKNVATNFTVTKKPVPQKNTSPGGINYLQDEADVANSKGHFFVRLLVFNLIDRTQSILFISQNENGLAHYKSDLDHFIASLKENNAENANTINTSTDTNTSPASSTASGLVHFNHFLFTIPVGWKSAQNGDYMTLTTPVTTADEMLSYILFPPVNDTNFQKAGDEAMKQLATSMGGIAQGLGRGDGSVYAMLHDGLYKKGWKYSFGSGTIQVNNQSDYTKSMSFIVGVYMGKIDGRIERVLYLSKNYRCSIYFTTTAYKINYEPVIDNFFFDMKFDDWEDTNVKSGKITSSGISGIWSGVSYLGGETKYDATFFILFDNGQVFYDSKFPKLGLYNLNTLSAAATRPDQWGTYTWQNGSGVMTISSWRTIPFSIKDGKLMANTGGSVRPFTKLPSIEGPTLNGTWCFEGSCISFTSDGKFTDDGVIEKLGHLPTTCDFIEPKNGQGTYEIKHNSIFFHYIDGITIQNAVSGLNIDNGNLSTSKLFLGWYNDVLEKK